MMIRFIVYLLLITLAAFAMAWFADHPGELGINWLGYRADSSMAVLAFAMILVFFLGMAVQRLLVFLARDLPFSKEKRARRRAEKGYGLLNQAMVALGSGDGKSARALSDKAVRLLPEQPLTHIMAAEAAKLSDDGDRVRQHYQALLDDDLAAFLGLRGLVLQERADGHSGKARELARRAVALRPKSHWALRTLVDFAVQAADWDEALETLDKASRAGVYDKAQSTQHRAALLYCQAVDANLANDQPHALELAQKAAGLRPGLPPAVALAARLHRQANQKKQAEKHLLAGWAAQPHPLLLKEWQAHFPTETAFARLQRIERLIASQPDHLESRLALATAAMGAERPDRAMAALEPVLESGDPRIALLRASLAVRAEDEDNGHLWREKAQHGVHRPCWRCANCGFTRDRWLPLCPSCAAFDRFGWHVVRGDGMALPSASASASAIRIWDGSSGAGRAVDRIGDQRDDKPDDGPKRVD